MSIQEKVEGYKKTLALFPNPQEKYQYLVKINPTLEELRKKFDLDIN